MNIKELDLIEKQDIRESVIDRTEVLDKVGDLLLLPNTEYATTEQVANYFGVTYQAIETIVSRHRDELEKYGLKYLQQHEVIEAISKNNDLTDVIKHQGYIEITTGDSSIIIANRGARLFSKPAILKIAFYLTDSKVALKVRSYLLRHYPDDYHYFTDGKILRFKRYEMDMEYFLKALFGDELVKTQVPCGKYKLDFVIDDTIHIEVDEHGHAGYNALYEKQREDYILNYTDYWTFRFNPQSDSKFELIRDIFELYEHIGFPNVKNNIKEECYGQ